MPMPAASASPITTPAGPSGIDDSSLTSCAYVPPPPALGALVGTVVGSASPETTRSLAVPVSLVPSHLTLTVYVARRTVPETWAEPRTHGDPLAAPVGVGEFAPEGTGLSVAPVTNALDVAVPVWAGPPLGTGQLARIHTVEVSPAVTVSGLSWTWIVGLVTVGLGVVTVRVAVGVTGGLGVPLAVGVAVGVPDGPASAEAVHPVRPTMTMAPAYATRLTLTTGRTPLCRLATSIHPNRGCRPS
jgi:hypothetical protein